ncbi:unnamed protein product [Moneuplotes crassus]|uniref:Arginyl-tRNA--protein transferase 1 n=1 Tax=Euplotes crassus TaxID=5936 RepID=A0AAD1U4I7_EUPCR|nr:unnamed protein product [Moneuplotes crassus]
MDQRGTEAQGEPRMDPLKSVINASKIYTKADGNSCGYCGSKEDTKRKIGFKTTKLNVEHYEKLLEKGFMRHGGATVDKPLNHLSCCHVFYPRVDITEFKISKQQKKHMKRFNQYMNGEREFTIEPSNIKFRSDKQITVASCMKNAFKKEIAKIYQQIKISLDRALDYGNRNFGTQLTVEEISKLKKDIKLDFSEEITKVDNLEDEDMPLNMNCNIKELLSKQNLNETFKEVIFPIFMNYLRNNIEFKKDFKIIDTEDEYFFMIEGSKCDMHLYQHNLDKLEDEEKYEYDSHGEKQHCVTGRETQIAIDAGKSRDYREFFKEFCPNPVPKEKRKHHYTASLHPAVFTEETCLLYKLFDKHIFDSEPSSASYERFLCSSCLFDPKDPKEKRTFKEPLKLDGDREFVDSGVYPEYLGSYHLHHRIDDVLFAVTVIDILPKTMTSRFCLYHPSYRFLSPGHFTAVREIEYMRMIREKFNKNLQYYSMMDFVTGCSKTEYKEHLHPIYLKCPSSLDWVLFTNEIKKKIENRDYETLDESSKPFEPPSTLTMTEWVSNKVIHTSERALPLSKVKRSVVDPLTEVFKEMGLEMSEMFDLEYK